MAVIKEYTCFAHGDFDSAEMTCPHGCDASMVMRIFKTAPAIQTQGYRNTNATFENLARDHRLSDMSNGSGEGMRRADYYTRKRLATATEMVSPNGRDVGEFFKPLKERFQVSGEARPVGEVVNPMADTRPLNGALYKDATGATAVGDGIRLGAVQPKLEAPAFNGSGLGLPAGES